MCSSHSADHLQLTDPESLWCQVPGLFLLLCWRTAFRDCLAHLRHPVHKTDQDIALKHFIWLSGWYIYSVSHQRLKLTANRNISVRFIYDPDLYLQTKSTFKTEDIKHLTTCTLTNKYSISATSPWGVFKTSAIRLCEVLTVTFRTTKYFWMSYQREK